MADTVVIMDAGRIVANGPIDSLKISGGAAVSLEQVFFEYVNRRQA